jgi:dipeptidase E
MRETRIMFAGGGDEHDSRPLDEIFARWLGKGRLLYLPTALMHLSNQQAGYRWIKRTFAPLGVTAIDAWMDLAGKTAQDLEPYAGVYVGGGNTFFLLQQVRMHGLDQALEAFARAGKPIYGGSAGAIILGQDITSCAHIDQNVIGLGDFGGLNLALGHTIWCHYTSKDAKRVQDYVQRTGVPSLALSEKSGAYRLGDALYAAGSEPLALYTLGGCAFFNPGELIEG